ncbi:Exonuclease RNase T/DNA polymerase III [Arabidopsis suecica]|uniref:Exonuclease RNase T/DNA polymerase III n=1 Tax=Arabidopsis suecica TaxID=45249 RepID=A0A8T1YRN3_ARASU|nr:Exonuclease RNase T/DNA polymerase III [Arabidopsis suecica]
MKEMMIKNIWDTCRNKCGGCYRQFNKKEHLVEHMRISYHSVHEPTCGICNKHCRSFDSLREHLIGPLPKQECKNIFSICGCRFCLTILESPNARRIHQERCQLSNVNHGLVTRMAALGLRDNPTIDYMSSRSPRVVALSCKMVGGGSDGSLDLCGRVCITDENENIVFHTYVKPTIPVTNYRYETTGIRPENLRDAMPLKHTHRERFKSFFVMENQCGRFVQEMGKQGFSSDMDLITILTLFNLNILPP